MTLPSPNLDDRTFQDLVREARAMIPRYCPEWTDHNLSDPGITLIELFAWMVETLLYRLNKVPDKNYIKFMELMGIRLEPPKPASVDITFRLSAPQPGTVAIPQGTEVATVRTETREAITFTTDADLVVSPPHLSYALTSGDDSAFEDRMSALKNPDQLVSVFEDTPQTGNALYLGFEENLSAQTLALSVKCRSEGIGIDPNDAPLGWEFWDGDLQKWSAIRVEKDTTGGLNTDGRISLHIPYGCTTREINKQLACWIRCVAVAPRPGQRPYSKSPRIRTITPECIGGTVPARHALRITDEILGTSNGQPGQQFTLRNTPVLWREAGESVAVQNDEGEFEPWQEVPDFAASGPDDPHFTCDGVSGEIQFGPSIKQPSGEERQYGMIPPSGRKIIFTVYRFGGGAIGNVGPKTITVLKSSIPYIASVINWEAARGGGEAESMQSAKMRAPHVLRARTRAVTSDDFEYLATQASPLVARAKCINPGSGNGASPEPGTVKVMIVPVVSQFDRPIPTEELTVTRNIREEVQAYLDERRLLGTHLEILAPKYVPVAVQVKVKGRRGTDFDVVSDQIAGALYRYIHPVYGGTENKGWPFGRGISVSEVHAAIQGTADFDYVEDVKLFPVDPATGERRETVTQISVSVDSLICSHVHEVMIR